MHVHSSQLILCFQFSIQDNGSAKFFQGALHTPNMGEKVAQVSTQILFHVQLILLVRVYPK